MAVTSRWRSSGLSEANLAKLPTRRLLAYIHQRVSPPGQTFALVFTGSNQPNQGTILFQNVTSGPIPNTVTTTTTAQVAPQSGAVAVTPWQRLLRGAAHFEAFSVVGHCLFALLAGLLGAGIALRMRAKPERDAAAASPPA